MVIGGFQKVSLIDFPGKISAIVFTSGCNFRCPFCYNQDLVIGSDKSKAIPEEEIFTYLKKRKKILEGVVITGGEPFLQGDLSRFLKRAKGLGFYTKLDTNGSHPESLQCIIAKGLVDFVAVDIKAPLGDRYRQAAGVDCDGEAVFESVRILIERGMDFELRTTVVPRLHKKRDLMDMATQIAALTPRPVSLKWYLQQFYPKNCLNPDFNNEDQYSKEELESILAAVRKLVPKAKLRGV